MKKLLLMIPLLCLSNGLFAQEVEQPLSFWSDPIQHPMMPVYAIGFVMAILLLLVIWVVYFVVKVLNILVESAAKKRAEELGIPYIPRVSGWQKLMIRLNRFTPIEKEETIMLDHNYDGIKELDNHLPPWWKYLFYITIFWGIAYLIVYHVTDSLPSQTEEFQAEMQIAKTVSSKVAAIDPQTLKYEMDESIIARGRELYLGTCASCHRPDGGGDLGPNLTDPYWLHGGEVSNVFITIRDGVPGTSMISWGGSFKPDDIKALSFFIESIKGSNPPNPKAPQGVLESGTTTKKEESATLSDSLEVN